MAVIESLEMCAHLSQFTDPTRGEVVCRDCGLVLEEKIPMEIGTGTREISREKSTRHHEVPSLAGTYFELPSQNIDLYRRLSKQQRQDPINRRFLWFKVRVDKVVAQFELPKIFAKTAYRYFTQLSKRQGRSTKELLGALIVLISRKHKLPVNFREIFAYLELPKKGNTAYKLAYNVARELGLKIPNTVKTPADYLPIFASKLGLSKEIQDRVLNMVFSYPKIQGKDPRCVLAGAIYIASKERGRSLRQADVAQAVGVTEVSLRKFAKVFQKK